MTCFYPIRGFRGPGGKVVASRAKSALQVSVVVPCGRCMGCRLDRARDWAVRISHEVSLHEHTCFVTLTYDNEHLPEGATLVKKHCQDFMKRLRKSIEPARVRFFLCGEYGGQNKRPHYHVLLFGYRPDDAWLWTVRNNCRVFRAPSLEALWTFGNSEFGEVTPASADYVARYSVKSAEQDADRFVRWDSETGETWEVEPEFCLMSRKPMIGELWFRKYASDCFPSDFLVVDGRKVPVPRAYKKRLSEVDEELRRKRVFASGFKFDPKVRENSTDERLRVREEVRREKLNRLKREL